MFYDIFMQIQHEERIVKQDCSEGTAAREHGHIPDPFRFVFVFMQTHM